MDLSNASKITKSIQTGCGEDEYCVPGAMSTHRDGPSIIGVRGMLLISMSNMFYMMESFNEDISGWNGSGWVFFEASSFSGDLSPWDMGNVKTIHKMFNDAISFNNHIR